MNTTAHGQQAKWATDLQFGVSQTLVASYSYDTGESRLWVNPTSSTDTFLQHIDMGAATTPISSLAFRQDFFSGGTANNEILIDAAAVGDDFDSVLAGLTPVPEPTTGVLALLGCTFVLLRRSGRS